jgi:hypothetical protein
MILQGQSGAAYAKQHWTQLKVDSYNWRVLWRDPTTGEYWKESFPHSEAHGGGPSKFERITEAQANIEFGLK